MQITQTATPASYPGLPKVSFLSFPSVTETVIIYIALIGLLSAKKRNLQVHQAWQTLISPGSGYDTLEGHLSYCAQPWTIFGDIHCRSASLFFLRWSLSDPNTFKLVFNKAGAVSQLSVHLCCYPNRFTTALQAYAAVVGGFAASPQLLLFLATRRALQQKSFPPFPAVYSLTILCCFISLQVCPVRLRSLALKSQCERAKKSPLRAPARAASPLPSCAGTKETPSCKVSVRGN